uniref:Uncharacterized protein n=1 Tax=Onchocerca volvulus TaxID=6282 RepID=A0A8R1XUT6_ONCVO
MKYFILRLIVVRDFTQEFSQFTILHELRMHDLDHIMFTTIMMSDIFDIFINLLENLIDLFPIKSSVMLASTSTHYHNNCIDLTVTQISHQSLSNLVIAPSKPRVGNNGTEK